jgi:uncharacterized repeat protein (TIGR03803 family)
MTHKEILAGLKHTAAASALVFLSITNIWAAGHERVLHTFLGKPGMHPQSGLISDTSGNLYGTTIEGGRVCTDDESGCGIVFSMTPTSTGWSYSVLYRFKGGHDGAHPGGNLIVDTAGSLFGTTTGGSQSNCGTIFELAPTSGDGWRETVLHRFQGGSDGCGPIGGLVFDQAGNLYGATAAGGTGCRLSCGTVFELSPTSSGWVETILYNFQGVNGNPDGAYPGGVTIDASGNLYGSTDGGGAGPCSTLGGCGTVFEVSPNSKGWTENVLYRFQGGKDGERPIGGVVFDSFGNLYGTTSLGGSQSDCGTVFELTPKSGSWAESILHRFKCRRDGGVPATGVTLDAEGNVYGTTQGAGVGSYGTIFRLVPVSGGGWTFSVLHGFTGNRDGGDPAGSLILDSTGSHLFGTTYFGGDAPNSSGFGVVFEITP